MNQDYHDLPPSEWPQFVKLSDIPQCVETENGFPYVNWDDVGDWLASRHTEHEFNDAYHLIAYQWLELLRECLEGNYEVHSSPNFYVLAELQDREALDFLRFAEATRENMLTAMGHIPEVEIGYGPHVAILFSDPDDMARYIVRGMPEEGEFGMPGGVMVNDGFSHIVMINLPQFQMEPVFTHELSHALLAALPLPLWLNEGVTEIVTHELTSMQPHVLDPEMMRNHRRTWNAETIQKFWTGDSFHAGGTLAKVSYSLAMVLCKNLSASYDCFPDFLRQADAADAGQAAALDIFDRCLGDVVADFLGPGDWEPKIETDDNALCEDQI